MFEKSVLFKVFKSTMPVVTIATVLHQDRYCRRQFAWEILQLYKYPYEKKCI